MCWEIAAYLTEELRSAHHDKEGVRVEAYLETGNRLLMAAVLGA